LAFSKEKRKTKKVAHSPGADEPGAFYQTKKKTKKNEEYKHNFGGLKKGPQRRKPA